MRIQHEIFHTPNKVSLTLTAKLTPPSYANYADGEGLGPTMPMWRVQTEGYTTHEGQLIGVVSRDAGFFDSPDVEWISGGVNSKGPRAVALGRHGNFFHWGFAASPTYMTAEAKDVFVNAVHYIAKYKGQVPIARKVQGSMLRSSIDSVLDGMTEQGYAKIVARYEGYQIDDKRRSESIWRRVEAGEVVSDVERQIMNRPPIEIPGRLDPARRYLSDETLTQLGNDPARVAAHLQKVAPFMHPTGWYELGVDESLVTLGVSNADPAMLDRAVALMASGEDVELGRTLLQRYTTESFQTAGEWATWLTTHRDHLFFSESCGYKWHVNTLDAAKTTTRPAPVLQASAREPIDVACSLEPNEHGGYTVWVDIELFEGWHAYDQVPPGSPYVPLEVSLALSDGVTQVGEWRRPESQPSAETAGLTTFEGRLTFQCDIEVSEWTSPAQLACDVRHQVCNEHGCMPPALRRLTQKIER